MTAYSGRTTAYQHKDDDWHKHKGPFESSIRSMVVFEAQWSDCPIEVEAEVKKLWRDNEFGNDHFYYSWDAGEHAADYPLINEYLIGRGVKRCLIHWWW